MNDAGRGHHQHGDPNGGTGQPSQRPYWTRAHRDWRVRVGVVLMLAAMIIYVMSSGLAWRYRIRAQPPLSGAAGK